MAPEQAKEDQPILIAYDGSDQAKAAIGLAGRNLRTPRDAVVVSVFEPLGAIPFWGVPVARVPSPFIQEAEDAAKKVSEEGAELARKAGFNATPAVIQGSPVWQKIVEAARGGRRDHRDRLARAERSALRGAGKRGDRGRPPRHGPRADRQERRQRLRPARRLTDGARAAR